MKLSALTTIAGELLPVVALALLPLGIRWAGIDIPLWLATAPIYVPLVVLYLIVYALLIKNLCTPSRKDAQHGNDPG